MTKSDINSTATIVSEPKPNRKKSGQNDHSGRTEVGPAHLIALLASLQTMRDCDFSVLLPGSWTGLEGKIADTACRIFSIRPCWMKWACSLRCAGTWTV